jgi:hypothetical protein
VDVELRHQLCDLIAAAIRNGFAAASVTAENVTNRHRV